MAAAFGGGAGGGGEQEEFPECPVCLEIPLGEIFQCPNRHNICGGCASKPQIQTCPLCRASLAQKQRNLELEAELDEMLIPCRNNNSSGGGCPHLLQRGGMEEHLEQHCEFGNRIPICKLLGFRCKFKLDPSNMRPAIQHCILEHSFGPTQEERAPEEEGQDEEQGRTGFISVVHQGWSEFTSALVEMGWAFFYNFSGREDALQLGPLALIFSSTNVEDKTFSTRCLLLGDKHGGNDLEARICYETKEDGMQWLRVAAASVRITSDTTTDIRKLPAVSVPLEAIKSGVVLIDKVIIEVARKETQMPEPDSDNNNAQVIFVKPSLIGDCVSRDVKCNLCNRPITLLRLKCLNCRTHNKCFNCILVKSHYPHVFAMLVSGSQEEFILRVERETPGRKGIVPGMTPKEACQGTVAKDKEGFQPFASPCSECEAPIGNVKFSCLSCVDVSLCETCVSKGNHDKAHIFAVILSNSQDDFMASRRQTRPVLLPPPKEEQ